MRPFQLSDLCEGRSLTISREDLRAYLASRTVLITGAGGSIGTTFCRQLLDLSPKHLVLADFSEHNLYRLDRTPSERCSCDAYTLCFVDVSDRTAMQRVLERHVPSVVVHTAAYKHVHLMERHPAAAFRNNTLATAQPLKASEQAGVDQFIYVSTDKAVAPEGILGRTKQLSEWYVRASAPDVSATTDRKVVRFGNVFGCRGSVVPLFERQIAEGRPVTVTHPDMARYFMSGQEAASLILQTPLLDEGSTYAFRMGDPVRIETLARRLVKHHHPEADPDNWIEHIGPRPGEKMREHLVASSEEVINTSHPDIVALRTSSVHDRSVLDRHFQRLQARDTSSEAAALRETLLASNLQRPTPQ
jgi:FlaA1/EpsC-like NDP-sugar epimerase